MNKLSSLHHNLTRQTSTLALVCASLSTACGSSVQTSAPVAPSSAAPAATGMESASVINDGPVEREEIHDEGPPAPGPNPNEIVGVIRTQDSEMRQCYMLGAFKNSELSGVVKVAFTIATSGRVSEVLDAGSDMEDQEVVDCVMDVFAHMEFRSGGVSPTEVTYPINFGSRG